MNIYLDEKLSRFMDDIMLGFQTTSLEVYTMILFIGFLITLTTVFYIIQNRSAYSRRSQYSNNLFDRTIESKNISRIGKSILHSMAKELKEGELRKHEVVTNAAIFDYCSRKLVEKGEISPELAAALRVKLGFSRKTEDKPIQATTELQEGIHIYFVDKNDNRYHGRLSSQNPRALTVALSEPMGLPKGRSKAQSDIRPETQQASRKGQTLTGYFRIKSGIYEFNTEVIEASEDLLKCTHSFDVKREQQRGFYRVELEKDASLRLKKEEAESRKTKIVDLGGGGAKVYNPENEFKKGDEVYLITTLEEEQEVNIPGHVLSRTNNNRYLHIRFDSIPTSLQDKIVGYVLQQGQR